jgi:hypothetical protein
MRGIQAADLLCSAFLFPMATYTYCLRHIKNDHAHIDYQVIRDEFGRRIKKLQFRYQDERQWWRGGIHTRDKLNGQRPALLFGPNVPESSSRIDFRGKRTPRLQTTLY